MLICQAAKEVDLLMTTLCV